MVFKHRFVHGDLHPGNILWQTQRGRRRAASSCASSASARQAALPRIASHRIGPCTVCPVPSCTVRPPVSNHVCKYHRRIRQTPDVDSNLFEATRTSWHDVRPYRNLKSSFTFNATHRTASQSCRLAAWPLSWLPLSLPASWRSDRCKVGSVANASKSLEEEVCALARGRLRAASVRDSNLTASVFLQPTVEQNPLYNHSAAYRAELTPSL